MGDGNQKRDFVDVHDVSGQKDITTLCHGGGWDVKRGNPHGIRRFAHSLPFKRTDIGTKDVFCIEDVHMGNCTVGQQVAVNNPEEILGA